MALSDDDLLRDYVRNGSNPAFSELVRRYLDPVYSAALRQVRSTALAEEISQSVFLDLSKNAAKLKPGQPLIAWLYVVTRRSAIDVIRRESRRKERERMASEIAAMKPDSSLWTQIEPFLDEALETLSDADRQAILLRYIASKSLREVGENLGTSEDAAQKRISRALEQLRTIFARRGIAITAAGLATDLSAHVVTSAPAGLGAAISSSALPTALLAKTAKTLSMTALNKTLIATAVVLIASLAYETTLLGAGRTQLREIEYELTRRQLQARQLAEERDQATSLLTQKRQALEAEQKRAAESAAVESDLDAWLGRVARLKEHLAQMPEKNIPEMRFLTSHDWLSVTLNNDVKTDDKIRKALSELRRQAKDKPEIGRNLQNALRDYARDHDNQPASDTAQLRPYLHPSIDDEILARYKFVSRNPTERMNAMEMSQTNETAANREDDQRWLQEIAGVDEDYDILLQLSARGRGIGFQYVSKLGDQVDEATQAFRKANGGQELTDPRELEPYFATPIDSTRLKQFWEARQQ